MDYVEDRLRIDRLYVGSGEIEVPYLDRGTPKTEKLYLRVLGQTEQAEVKIDSFLAYNAIRTKLRDADSRECQALILWINDLPRDKVIDLLCAAKRLGFRNQAAQSVIPTYYPDPVDADASIEDQAEAVAKREAEFTETFLAREKLVGELEAEYRTQVAEWDDEMLYGEAMEAQVNAESQAVYERESSNQTLCRAVFADEDLTKPKFASIDQADRTHPAIRARLIEQHFRLSQIDPFALWPSSLTDGPAD